MILCTQNTQKGRFLLCTGANDEKINNYELKRYNYEKDFYDFDLQSSLLTLDQTNELMDEQGNITERKPTEFVWNVKFNQKGNAYRLTDETNLRVVRIPSEKRQQIIDAFHKFEKK